MLCTICSCEIYDEILNLKSNESTISIQHTCIKLAGVFASRQSSRHFLKISKVTFVNKGGEGTDHLKILIVTQHLHS